MNFLTSSLGTLKVWHDCYRTVWSPTFRSLPLRLLAFIFVLVNFYGHYATFVMFAFLLVDVGHDIDASSESASTLPVVDMLSTIQSRRKTLLDFTTNCKEILHKFNTIHIIPMSPTEAIKLISATMLMLYSVLRTTNGLTLLPGCLWLTLFGWEIVKAAIFRVNSLRNFLAILAILVVDQGSVLLAKPSEGCVNIKFLVYEDIDGSDSRRRWSQGNFQIDETYLECLRSLEIESIRHNWRTGQFYGYGDLKRRLWIGSFDFNDSISCMIAATALLCKLVAAGPGDKGVIRGQQMDFIVENEW